MDNCLEKRVIELETLVSYQDHTIEQLNQVIYSQQLKMDEISAKIDAVEGLIKNQTSDDKRTLEEERPPHY